MRDGGGMGVGFLVSWLLPGESRSKNPKQRIEGASTGSPLLASL